VYSSVDCVAVEVIAVHPWLLFACLYESLDIVSHVALFSLFILEEDDDE
jgi:hypothetical protein